MTYFRPWTAWESKGNDHVLDVRKMYTDEWDWSAEMQKWLGGQVLTLEMERCVRNFFMVVQARPESGADGDDVHDDDVYEDADMQLSTQDLQELLRTSERCDVVSDADGRTEDASFAQQAAAMELGDAIWNSFDIAAQLKPLLAEHQIAEERANEAIKEAQKIERRGGKLGADVAAERVENVTLSSCRAPRRCAHG